MLLQWVEIELLAAVGWKWGCQPFSCPCSQIHRRKDFFRHSCPRNPCLLWNLSVHTPEAWGSRERQHASPALQYGCIMPTPSLQLQKKARLTQRREAGLVEEYSDLRWFHVTTAEHWIVLEIEHLTKVGWKCCQPFSCLCWQNVITVDAKKRCVSHACLGFIRNLNLHSLPVRWCSWEQVFYDLPPPVHGDSFAAKELLSPLLSPCIILTHRIQSTAGRIWPLIERFDRCAAVCCDSALIRWRSIAAVPSKIQDFAEFDGFISSWRFLIAGQGSRDRSDHLQAEGNECSPSSCAEFGEVLSGAGPAKPIILRENTGRRATWENGEKIGEICQFLFLASL